MFRIIAQLFLIAHVFANLPPPAQLFCPTIGTTASVLVTITPKLGIDAFGALLEFYAKLMPYKSDQQITYDFYFGANFTQIIRTNSLQDEIDEWVHDESYLNKLYSSSLIVEEDYGLVNLAKSILDQISKVNQVDSTVFMKKQVVLLTDYVPNNVTDVFDSNVNENTQILGILHEINTQDFDKAADFPVFSMEDSDISGMRAVFQQNLNFEFPAIIHEDKPLANIQIFMSASNTTDLIEVVQNSINGPACRLSDAKMYSKFIEIQLIQNDTNWQLTLPWLGGQTEKFSRNCLSEVENVEASKCSEMKSQIFENYVSSMARMTNITYAYLFIDNVDCANVRNLKTTIRDSTHVRLVMSQDLNSIYEQFTLPLENLGFLDSAIDNQVIFNNQFYLHNYSTSCLDEMAMVPLLAARPYNPPKYLSIALDDMLTICICATISVSTFGVLIYCRVRRTLKKQVELLNEILLQPRIYKAPKECAKVQRLPWEIKSDMVHIDTEFLLGEGTISNVYLGKLRGKAPIMQWIDRIEMKQYQDCAVAVRVPRHFDEPEEDQLQREIASMRQLRHHDHIALLLGWTNKNDLVCSLLELTHMNLIKYLAQIRDSTEISSNYAPLSKIPFNTLYKIIYETCDGIEYLHSRNLVHRDLTARNILLTTGLRAKISGFGFCSEPGDQKFMINSLALRYLPVRWLAPECFNGKFSVKSDSWAFGVLMYEMFTLGDQPYEDLLRPEDIIESVKKGRIPGHPKYATKQTYKIMQGCFETFSSRRPTFTQLKNAFQTHSTSSYTNPVFEDD